MDADTRPPQIRTKLIFWLLLSVLSVAIAEVSVASAPLAFVNPGEGVFLLVFYGCHLLLFAWLTFRRGWPTLPGLWFAGVLFGLYEFYITKVLWVPPWGDVLTVGYIDIAAFVVLAFFWHPFMAFILPLAVGESMGTRTRWVSSRLPGWLTSPTSRHLVAGVALAALTHGMLTGSPTVAVVSTLSAGLVFVIVARWWRKNGRASKWALRDLLPSDRQAKGLAGLLAAQYAIFVPLWNAEKMPPLGGHLVVWLLYAGFGFLLAAALRSSELAAGPVVDEPNPTYASPGPAVAGILGLTLLGSLLPPELGFVAVWLVAIVVGLRTAYGSVRAVLSTSGSDDGASAGSPLADRGDGQARRS
jgi:hypothetical protein